MPGRREVERDRSWVSSGDRLGLGDPLGGRAGAHQGHWCVPAAQGRARGLSGLLVHGRLAAHAVGLLVWGEGQDPSGCGAVIKKRALDLSRELSAPGPALLLRADGCHRSGAAKPALGVTVQELAL